MDSGDRLNSDSGKGAFQGQWQSDAGDFIENFLHRKYLSKSERRQCLKAERAGDQHFAFKFMLTLTRISPRLTSFS
jgi:hypothetical protein